MLDTIIYYSQIAGEIISSVGLVTFLGILPFIFYMMLVKKIMAYCFF